jgi:outer membrane lipoprotein-sorting protein
MLPKLLLLILIFACSLTQTTLAQVRLTDAAEILRRMEDYARRRTESIQAYSNTRSYHVEYRGIVNISADMKVRMIYTAPDNKRFEIISESGSKILRNRVLRKLLQSEVEAAQRSSREESAITPGNYSLRLHPGESPQDDAHYVFEVTPRKKAKFLLAGKIWVDERDFAITRIEGRPAVNPSWWVKEARILHTYRKVEGFWLYDSNESTSKVRIGGKAILNIRYEDYSFESSGLQVGE